MRKLCGLLPLVGLCFGFSATARAAEVTRVASSFDGDHNKFDLHFGVGYDFNFKKSAILREWSDENNPDSKVVRDLIYQQMRHVVTPSLEIGLYKDLAVYMNIPIVVADSRLYKFDQEAADCKYDDGMRSPDDPATCVNHDNSTTIRDGIIGYWPFPHCVSPTMILTPFQEKLNLLLLFLVLFALETVVAQRYLTSQIPGANDFYSRWHGAKALLLEGRDPYGLDVTAEIQPVIGIDPSEVGRGGFAYPLHVIFLFWPLVYLPYDWTQAIWLVMLQWLAIGMGIALIGWKRLSLKPAAALGVLLSVLFFYPVARTILLGQFTLHVAFFLAMALWLLDRGRDEWAGVFLAATSVKPQMVIFIGPWVVLWAIGCATRSKRVSSDRVYV